MPDVELELEPVFLSGRGAVFVGEVQTIPGRILASDADGSSFDELEV